MGLYIINICLIQQALQTFLKYLFTICKCIVENELVLIEYELNSIRMFPKDSNIPYLNITQTLLQNNPYVKTYMQAGEMYGSSAPNLPI